MMGSRRRGSTPRPNGTKSRPGIRPLAHLRTGTHRDRSAVLSCPVCWPIPSCPPLCDVILAVLPHLQDHGITSQHGQPEIFFLLKSPTIGDLRLRARQHLGSVAEKGEMTPQAKSQCSVERRDRTGAHADALSDRSPAPRSAVMRNPVKVVTRSTVNVIADSTVSDQVSERSDAGVRFMSRGDHFG